MSRPRPRCAICGERTLKPTFMCSDCAASYDAHAHDDGSVAEAMIWAARRARWYAQRRRTAGVGVTVMLTLAELEHLRDFAHNVDDHDHDAWWEQLDKKLNSALRIARSRCTP